MKRVKERKAERERERRELRGIWKGGQTNIQMRWKGERQDGKKEGGKKRKQGGRERKDNTGI